MENKFYELESHRLRLRQINLNDVDDLYEYGSDDEVAKYVLWSKYQSKENAVDYIDMVMKKYAEGNFNAWAIELKDEEKMIGMIDFVAYNERHQRAELGYVLNQHYWGKGIMSEAAKLVLEHGFKTLKLHKISAGSIDLNVGSYRVMEKIGMKREGIHREHFIKDGVYYDIIMYSVLEGEYNE